MTKAFNAVKMTNTAPLLCAAQHRRSKENACLIHNFLSESKCRYFAMLDPILLNMVRWLLRQCDVPQGSDWLDHFLISELFVLQYVNGLCVLMPHETNPSHEIQISDNKGWNLGVILRPAVIRCCNSLWDSKTSREKTDLEISSVWKGDLFLFLA